MNKTSFKKSEPKIIKQNLQYLYQIDDLDIGLANQQDF